MEKEKKFNLNRIKELAGQRMEMLCDDSISHGRKKVEHQINEDFCLLATQYLKANDQQIRMRRLKLDEETLGKTIKEADEQQTQI